MEKGVYKYTSSGWKNCNDDLSIRGITNEGNTINGVGPTVENVPHVYAYTSAGWDQIYPAKESRVGKQTIVANVFDHYKNCRTTGVNWGWDGRRISAGHGYFGQDWVNSGGQDMSLVNKEYIGWMDLGTATRSKLPRHADVKEIKYLEFVVYRRNLTGLTGTPVEWSLCLNEINGPGVRYATSPDPFGGLVGSRVVVGTFPAGQGYHTIKVDLTTTRGKAVAELFKSWMRGDAGVNSIVMYNDERKDDDHVWGKYGHWSRNYTKITELKMIIDYTV